MHLKEEEISSLQKEAGTEFPLTITEKQVEWDIADVALADGAELIVIGRGKAQANFGSRLTHLYEILPESPLPSAELRGKSARTPFFNATRRDIRGDTS